MVRNSVATLGLASVFVAGAGLWAVYQRATTDEVPYTVVGRVGDDVELRRYPSTVLVETSAPTESAAFRRLFRYISGANVGADEIAMTAPVEVSGRGTSLPMTAPVEVGRGRATTKIDSDEVRMAFYLPATYDIDQSPRPTDPTVKLVSVPARTLAVRRFSGRPTDTRIASEEDKLLSALQSADVTVRRAPFFMGYDAPWTLPFLRRNEVAVEIEAEQES